MTGSTAHTPRTDRDGIRSDGESAERGGKRGGKRTGGRVGTWLSAHPSVADALLPLGFIALLFLSGGTTGITGMPGLLFDFSSTGALFLWSCALAVPVAFRRSHPKTAALAFAALSSLQLIAGPTIVPTDLFALLMLYSSLVYGRTEDTRRYVILALALGTAAGMATALVPNAGSLVTTLVTTAPTDLPQYAPSCATLYRTGLTGDCAQTLLRDGLLAVALIWALLVSVTIIAMWNRARRATILAMQERNAALEAGEAEERHIAALAERARIARDMHDVVAHTLSTIIIQSDGGRYAGAHDPSVARTTMETIRRESEHALHDMKRLFGVFGGSAHAGYEDLDALVATANAALETANGGSISRRITGEATPAALGGQAGMAVYRLVQEALTNARKYAGPGVHVTIDERWEAGGLSVTVADDGRGAAAALDGHQPGYGLIGMHERISAVGGTVNAGPRVGGGYMVQAWVPYAGTGMAAPHAGGRTGARTDAVPTAQAADRNAAQTAGQPAHADPTATASQTSPWRATQTDRPVSARPSTQSPGRAPSQSSVPAERRAMAQRTAPPAAAFAATVSVATASAPCTVPSATPPALPSAARSNATASAAAASVSTAAATGSAGRPAAAGVAQSDPHAPTPPQRHAAGESEAPDVPVAFTARIREAFDALRANPLKTYDAGESRPSNIVERLSRWSERHYLAVDMLQAVALLLLCLWLNVYDSPLFSLYVERPGFALLSGIVMTLSLAFRRRFPEGSAAVVSGFAAIQLLVMPGIIYADLFALGSLYAAIVYGRERSWRWIAAAVGADSLLAGVNMVASLNGYGTIADALWQTTRGSTALRSTAAVVVAGAGYAVMVAVVCAGVIALGRWTRSRGSNALVLQMREDALRAERAKQKVLAANMERDRIGAAIQTEVAATLTGVIDRAVAGLTMLDNAERRGETPSPEAIVAAFEAIGQQGRAALAHMRQLLGVLRETGSTDEAHQGGLDAMRLAPAASLDDQMARKSQPSAKLT